MTTAGTPVNMENLPSGPGIATTVETPPKLVDLPAPLLAKILMWLKNGNVDKIPIVKCALVELLAHELLCNHLYARVITEEEAIEQGLPCE